MPFCASHPGCTPDGYGQPEKRIRRSVEARTGPLAGLGSVCSQTSAVTVARPAVSEVGSAVVSPVWLWWSAVVLGTPASSMAVGTATRAARPGR